LLKLFSQLILMTDLAQLERAKPSNPYNYSKIDLAKKEQAIKAAMRDYPNIPAFYIEMAYDCVENTPEDEMKEIIDKDLWINFKKEKTKQ